MPVVLNVVESTTALGITTSEVVIESASAPGPAGVGVPAGGTVDQVLAKASGTDYDTEWVAQTGGGGGGAPTDATYLTATAHASLPGEVVVGATPGGELGGTWAAPTVDATHSGSTHAAVQAAAEATAAADATAKVAAEAALARNADNLTSGTVAEARIPGTIARDSEVAAAYQPLAAVLTNTTAAFLAADETKLDYLAVTQAVDLDAIETRVNSLDAAVVLRGSWDASAGTFPGSGTAQAGDSYIVSVAGTVNAVVFSAGDRVVAITDNASTTTYAANWLKLDYTDQVLSVAGQTGAVTLAKGDVGLGNVDNTSDANKPVSTAAQTALDLKLAADLTALTELTAFTGDETFYVVEDDDGTPVARRMTIENIAAGLAARAELVGAFLSLLNVPVVVSGTTDTLAAADSGKVNRYTNAAAVAVTLPTDASDDLADGFACTLIAEGAGGLSLVTTGLTIAGGSNTAISQGEALVVIKTATANTWNVIGGTA